LAPRPPPLPDGLPVAVADPVFAEIAVLAPVSAAAPVVEEAALAAVFTAVGEAAPGEEFAAAAAPPADAVNLS
jgi:hypothetical protein